jgi:CxxC-x17-CxxC domain-containing protein
VIAPPKEEIKDLASLLTQREPAGSRPAAAKKDTPSFPIICKRCGKAADVPFEPDPDRPVYCKECLQIIREEKKNQPMPKRPAETPVRPSQRL